MVTDWPLVALRFALYADLGVAFGLPLFGLYMFARAERREAGTIPFGIVIGVLGAAGLLLSALHFAVTAAAMGGTGITELDRELVNLLIHETPSGSAFLVRMAALALLTLAALLHRGNADAALWLATVAGGVALATLAWNGHGAASEGTAGIVHLISDFLHLWSASLWLGALVALMALLLRRRPELDHVRLTHRSLEGFSRLGTLTVAILTLSGIVNGAMVVGLSNLGAAAQQLYGQLLLVKLLLFAAMIGLAAANRFRLTPRLQSAIAGGDSDAALARLRTSLALETVAALLILALVGWLGTLEPIPSV